MEEFPNSAVQIKKIATVDQYGKIIAKKQANSTIIVKSIYH